MAVVIFFLFLIVLRISLSQIIIYSTQSWLNKQGIHSSIEDIQINITGGTVSLHNANGHKGDQPLFDIGLLAIHWDWAPLSEKVIEVTKVEVDGLNLAIKQFRDEIIIGGVSIPLQVNSNKKSPGPMISGADDSIANELAQPWAAALNEVVFRHLNVCYPQRLFLYTIIKTAQGLQPTVSYRTVV